jgi:hypothetical protein
MPYIIDKGKVIPVNVNNKYDSKPASYPIHDLNSVYTHWDDKLKRNVPTPNELPKVKENKNE